MSRLEQHLDKCFGSLAGSIILPMAVIGHYLVKCAKSHTYVETLGKHADSLHKWIKHSYVEDFRTSLETQVRHAIKALGISYAQLAFDITDEPFWGKQRSLYIFNCEPDKKYPAAFKFITVCLITRNKQIPLMALPIKVGEGSADLAIDLLKYCQSLFKGIRLVLFDRGFYIAQLIDYLEAKHIRYLILVPEKKGAIKEYMEQTEEMGVFRHCMTYSRDKSTWKPTTNIIVCKGIDDYAWIFVTNIHFRTRCEYIWWYKRRWQIETNFRVEDEARIKSKSANHVIRYFYFLVSLLLHLMWIVTKNVHRYVPFKRYLDEVEHKLFFYDYLGMT
jgi:hypothetical protein